jgi:cyclopropane fatty-acyl-phospholipid synthase-like methyltransferase
MGATNLDSRIADPIFGRKTAVDLLMDARDLPGECAGKYSHVNCGDMLEHFPVDDVPNILRKLKACLVPGGELVLTIPDDHRPVDKQHAGSDGSHEYSNGVSAVHTHSVTGPMLDEWMKEAGLKIEVRQEIDCHWYLNHGIIAVAKEEAR